MCPLVPFGIASLILIAGIWLPKKPYPITALAIAMIVFIVGMSFFIRQKNGAKYCPQPQIEASDWGWVKIVEEPIQVNGFPDLWQLKFQKSDAETLTAFAQFAGRTGKSDTWKVGAEVYIVSVPSSRNGAVGFIPMTTYFAKDFRAAKPQ